MNENKYIEILKGQITDLPQKQSKKVKIFLSSTFSGTFLGLFLYFLNKFLL
jgi:hypothetical protein